LTHPSDFRHFVFRARSACGGTAPQGARWLSIGESDTLNCLVPDNWSAIFAAPARHRLFLLATGGFVAVQYVWD
jgi:hypothetical protein